MNLSERFMIKVKGEKEEHILKSRSNELYALMSNWDSNPPHISVYRNKNLIAKVPIFENAPSPDKIVSLTGEISENDKKDIYDFLIGKCHVGLTTWRSAYSLWDILH